jgi:putative oxidoreductase
MPHSQDIGLLALRVGSGAVLIAHGTQKLFGWFGGGGLDGTAAVFDEAGFRPGRANAMIAGMSEASGGALLAAGLATPAAGAAVAGTMVVASSMLAPNGFFATKGGYEYAALLAVVGLSTALTGPGALSLDEATGHRLDRRWMRAAAVAAVAPAAIAVIAKRRRSLAADNLTVPDDPAQDGAGHAQGDPSV